MSAPAESNALSSAPVTVMSSVTERADHVEEPPVLTVRVNALSPLPPSVSFPESQARSTIISVQSTTETRFSE